jgi:hypothetical protein
MRVPKPILPIEDNYARAACMHQRATGYVTLVAFLRSWSKVRRERRQRERKRR